MGSQDIIFDVHEFELQHVPHFYPAGCKQIYLCTSRMSIYTRNLVLVEKPVINPEINFKSHKLLHFYVLCTLSSINSLHIFSYTHKLNETFLKPSHFILMLMRKIRIYEIFDMKKVKKTSQQK